MKGYRVDGCSIRSPSGKLRVIKFNDKYPKFNISHKGKIITVKCHHLTAYQKYLTECFKKDILVRHLDDDPLNFASYNIDIGNMDDNMMDKQRNKYEAFRQRKNQSVHE